MSFHWSGTELCLSSHSGVFRITCSYPDEHSSILILDQQCFLFPKPCMAPQDVRGREKDLSTSRSLYSVSLEKPPLQLMF